MIWRMFMAEELILKNGKIIRAGCKPYIIAELNSSHNGNLEVAKEMIRSAKECGCDCVKFQSWTADTLYCKEYYEKNPIAKRIVSKFAMPEEALLEMVEFCKEIEIDFSSTPYSEREVDFLVENCQVPFIKIASMEINHHEFLRYIAKKKLPMILSTGMATMGEIKDAVDKIVECGNSQLCILHCTSIYPAAPKDIALNNIVGLQKKFPQYPIGFSDHSIGSEMAVAAVALGATVVEKHFTLDNKKMGMDNNMATEPEQFKALVEACHNVSAALGTEERVLNEEELEQRKKMRRSLVAARDLPAGTVLTKKDLVCKRPGDGISPERMGEVIGNVVISNLDEGFMIRKENLEENLL